MAERSSDAIEVVIGKKVVICGFTDVQQKNRRRYNNLAKFCNLNIEEWNCASITWLVTSL